MSKRKKYEAEIVSVRLEVWVTVTGPNRGDSGRHFTINGTNRGKLLDDLDAKLANILYAKEEAERLDDKILGVPMTEEDLAPPGRIRTEPTGADAWMKDHLVVVHVGDGPRPVDAATIARRDFSERTRKRYGLTRITR